MRATKLYVAGLVLAGMAGCGTALAAEQGHTPAPVAPSSSAAPSPSSTSVPPAPASTSTASASSVASSLASSPALNPGKPPATTAPAAAPATSSAPPASTWAAQGKHGGPANSLMVTGTKGVALTFDDGPDPANTPQLLDLLAKHHVKATFCLVGENVKAFPDLVRRIAAEGHTLCNHTWNHSLTLGKKKPAAIHADLEKTNQAIRDAVPGAEIKYMRAPGGNFTPAFVKEANRLGMVAIYWQIDTRDWDHSGGESDGQHTYAVIKTVKKKTRPGAIVLSHDYAQPDTIAAYRKLLPWLKKHYTLVALP